MRRSEGAVFGGARWRERSECFFRLVLVLVLIEAVIVIVLVIARDHDTQTAAPQFR